MRIYLVVAPGPLVLGAYRNADSAHLHARCVTGASVVECELLDRVPEEIREDIFVAEVEDFDDNDTPVETPPPPAVPRTRTKNKI